jgi:D-beta-D-heptose 7-phosphate kinase/D-beta-D-heptose 1-phosphate adenosyltransferase
MDTRQQKKFNILLVGDSCIDQYQYGSIDRISPEAPVPVFKFSHAETRPGMAGNVNANLEALECNITFITDGEPSTKTRLIDARSKQHIVRIDNDIQAIGLQPGFINHINDYDAVLVSDYNKGVISYELIEWIIKEFNGPIFVDTKKTELARLEGCTVKINALEYSLLKSECSELIVTNGKDGAMYKGQSWKAPQVEVTDVCGAGDTFLAALAVEFLNTSNIVDSIVFANKAAAITVQHTGVYAPTLKEIECQD